MRILLATDGSEEARAATTWLLTFPLPRSATVRVLTVATPQSPPTAVSVEEYGRTLWEQARLIVSEARDVLVARWADVQERVTDGDPREAIVRATEEWPADLVVVGARGLSPLKRMLLGSVSTSVARYAPCPVLIVRGAHRQLRTAIVAVDGSADARRAASFFASLPLGPRTVVRLMAAVAPPVDAGLREMPDAAARLERVLAARQATAERMLGELETEFRARVLAVERRVVVGHAGEAITSAAGEPDVDLVVVGARGLGSFMRLLVGSTSEYLLNHAECPILIVRPRQTSR